MKQNIYLVPSMVFLFLICTFLACKKDFLNVPPASDPVRQDYVSDLTSSENFLRGIYIDFSTILHGSFYQIYPDLKADNVKPKTGFNVFVAPYNWNEIASATATSSNGTTNGLWTAGYKVIRNSSFLIEEVDKYSDENMIKAREIKGQAYALRAFAHFNLVNLFAQPYKFTVDASHPGIPYVTVSDWTIPVTRQSVANVYAGIINDLNSAIALLPSTKDTHYIYKTAAKALLARVLLFKGDYLGAKNIAIEVGSLVPIMTGSANYPSKLFTPQETEALFQLRPNIAGYSTEFASFYYRSNIQFYASPDLVDNLRERANDKRIGWLTLVSGNWTITKFPSGAVSGITNPANAYLNTVIRSSEMYLTAAESYAKIGRDDSARVYLDAIRLRADASAPISVATGPALLDSIYKERRKELCFESLRLFDLLRNASPINRVNPTSPAPAILSYPNSKAIAPIPINDVQYSGILQNPGY